jgi:hypothetical protein
MQAETKETESTFRKLEGAYGHRPGFRLVLVRPADAKQLVWASARLRPAFGRHACEEAKKLCACAEDELGCGLDLVCQGFAGSDFEREQW